MIASFSAQPAGKQMSLETFPPSNMTSTPVSDEKTPLMRSVSASNDGLDRSSTSLSVSGHLQHSKHFTTQRHLPSQVPAQNSFFPLVCVLLTVVLERLVFYGVVANLLIFLINETQFNQSVSTGIVFIFTGLSCLMSTVGGTVGDSYSGRYNAVWGSLLAYMVGIGMICSSAIFSDQCDKVASHEEIYRLPAHVLCLVSLFIISTGEGAYKANVTAFGGDQLRGQDEQRYRRFFNWYYWSTNIGSFLGFSVIAYVEQKKSFKWGFGILFGCIVLAAVIFCIGRSCYVSHPPTGHIVKKIRNIIKEAMQKKKEEENSAR